MTHPMLRKMESITIETDTPDGVLYTTIMEDDDGTPVKIQAIIGKAGYSTAAWATALGDVASFALENGAGINDLITLLSSQTSSGRVRTLPDGEKIRSGPEGICVALMKYRAIKFKQLRATLDGDYDDFSGPSIS